MSPYSYLMVNKLIAKFIIEEDQKDESYLLRIISPEETLIKEVTSSSAVHAANEASKMLQEIFLKQILERKTSEDLDFINENMAINQVF